jgi:tyrosinase
VLTNIVNTFPTWHRPYVALYEQLLAGYFPGIISQYSATNASVGQALQNASQTWRLPYWDWAINTSLPNEWTSNTIQILGTDGNPTSVTNPFSAYQFNPIDPSFAPYAPPDYPDYSQWPTTIRQPTDSEDPNATSQPDVSNQQLSTTDFKALILDLFPSQLFEPDPWGQFSNHTWDSIHRGQPTLTSLEGIHDTIHTDVGGEGHMGDPAVAAFDPIFWLHHCNVDRLLCLWQAAYPTVYVSAGPDMAGTFLVP